MLTNRRPPDTTLSIRGRDGVPCRLWINPVGEASVYFMAGLRGLLTASDLYLWQGNVMHADVVRAIGIDGVRLVFRPDLICVHDETVALPEHFPWIFAPFAVMEGIDDRWVTVTHWLRANQRIRQLYPGEFGVIGYQ